MNKTTIFTAAILACFSILATASEQIREQQDHEQQDRVHGESHEHEVLEEVRVTATPLAKDALEMTQSASVLADETLDRELGNSLGDTLKNMPGVSSASFGANVGRPVIRGLDASRVGVMENNMSSNDVSKVSQDHAVSIEPFLADQIEVLRGPATLLYGSDTIGGVVNARTNRIPAEQMSQARGRAMLQLDSASAQKYGVGRLDWGAGEYQQWAFHADGFVRRTDDYEIPGYAETEPEPGEEPPGTLVNSALDNEGGAFGASWFGEKWRSGVSWSRYDSTYGIPGEAHHHDDEGEGQGEDDEHLEDDGQPERVTIEMSSDRLDAELQADQPFAGFEQFKLLVNRTDYTHTEFEGPDVGTVFENDTLEGRIELTHERLGDWHGVLGAHFRDRDFSALGEEAFVPGSNTKTLGVFVLEEAEFDRVRFDFGARYEDIDTTAIDGRMVHHSAISASTGALWHVHETTHIALNLARAQRTPGDQELFANGPHIATQTFELGDAGLTEETSTSYEASIRKHLGRLTGALTLYRNDFDDFIYLEDTGLEEDGLPVRRWTQSDAQFHGFELELRYDMGTGAHGHWQFYAMADSVNAELSGGTNLPRQPPSKAGIGVEWDRGPWLGGRSWVKLSRQDETAPLETATPGYSMVDANISWRNTASAGMEHEIFLKASNLLDEEVRNHASFLKDRAPQTGRNLVLGVRFYF